MSTVKLALHKDLVMKTANQIVKSDQTGGSKKRKLHREKHCEGTNILLLESGALSKSSQILIAFFTIYGGSKIW